MSETLYALEEFVNETKGYRLAGEGKPQECFTSHLKTLFDSLQKEYGRCTSRCYIDRLDGKTTRIGWVFQKRVEYEDAPPFDRNRTTRERFREEWTYERSVWISLYTKDEEGDFISVSL